MSLLKVLAEYDADREAYIRKLEARIEELEGRASDAIDLMMKGEALRERTMLDAIMAGAYSKPASLLPSEERGAK